MAPNLNLDLLSPQWVLLLNGTVYGTYYTQAGAQGEMQRFERESLTHSAQRQPVWQVVNRHDIQEGCTI